MDAINIFGVTVGGILLLLFVLRARPSFTYLADPISVWVSKHLLYPYFLNRHRWVGPWTRAGAIICLIYGGLNIFLLLFQVKSEGDTNLKSGRLALLNMIPLFMTVHQSLLADILGISLQTCQWIHRASGWMVGSMVALHVLIALSIQQNLSLQREENVFAIVVCHPSHHECLFADNPKGAATLGTIMIFSIPIFRKHFYELFLRTHQGLAAVCFYAIWKHLPSNSTFPRLYLYVPLVILGLTTLYQCGKLLYQNGFMSSRLNPRATVTCKKAEPIGTNEEPARHGDNGNSELVVKMTVTLGRPLELRAGQYIQLWMPSVSFSS